MKGAQSSTTIMAASTPLSKGIHTNVGGVQRAACSVQRARLKMAAIRRADAPRRACVRAVPGAAAPAPAARRPRPARARTFRNMCVVGCAPSHSTRVPPAPTTYVDNNVLSKQQIAEVLLARLGVMDATL